MLVCWEWLSQYVDLSVEPDELAVRFAMTGLNHESTEIVGGDTVLDLEVTSNRGDCLGHIGIAREAAVILRSELRIPEAHPATGKQSAIDSIQVVNRFPAGCPRYTARIIRGVKVGPSPQWLVRRLKAIGIASVNNIVDVTNYVMMECGQPLHAFDLQQVRGGQIIVRPAREREELLAIDHRTYQLDPQMVVIADAERALAIGGVMGGAESEVSGSTVDLLIEAASFAPLVIRRAARLLKLQSPSSFRFERRPDPAGVDWASRRCCALILQTAGGELCSGVVDAGQRPLAREPIPFRLDQIPRLLGVDIAKDEVVRILISLDCDLGRSATNSLVVIPPTWRGDLVREVDLIEEVARVFGYERIPENIAVPLQVANVRPKDLAMSRVRHTLSAYGIDEAMTASVVSEPLEVCGSLWTNQPPLETETPLLVGSRLLRRSLLPSLLAARHANQTQSIRNAQLYEVANIYLPADDPVTLPREVCALGIVTRGDLRVVKGIVEEIVAQVACKNSKPIWRVADHSMFAEGSLQSLTLGDSLLGYVGLVSRQMQLAMSLDQPVAAAELDVDALTQSLEEVRGADRVSLFPAMSRDLNFIVDEETQWHAIEKFCRQAGGELLQNIHYQETYRDTKRDGAGKKRLLISLHFQSLDRTLTSEEVDSQVARIISNCAEQLGARLLEK